MTDIYDRLAQFLDDLPAGFPRTDSGIELKILRKLFTPAEAEMFLHLTLLAEEPRVVAYRAGKSLEQTTRTLEGMEHKGLISGSHAEGKLPHYAASQFVVGFWEDQVNRLDREMAELFEQYVPHYYEQGYWTALPQLRTIPVGESIPIHSEVMPYEKAEAILRSKSRIAVRNCVCRQQRALLDKSCGKPLETCLSFDGAAYNTAVSGKGRLISLDEALAILALSERAGLVLQPANSKNPAFLCACCSCCCGVLRHIKHDEKPAGLVSNAFSAQHDPALCLDCGLCVERCQMDAITESISGITIDHDRCIGCGLCISECPSGALTLVRKPDADRVRIPGNTLDTYVRLGQARNKLGVRKIMSIALRSGLDRLMAPRDD